MYFWLGLGLVIFSAVVLALMTVNALEAWSFKRKTRKLDIRLERERRPYHKHR